VVLKGVWDVRLPYGYERSSTSPETTESPIPHIKQDKKKRFYSLYDRSGERTSSGKPGGR